MSNKKLRIAVIGCGIITWRHLDGMSRIDDCEVYALCETVQDGRAEKLKDKYCTPETKIVTDYKELIGDPNVDAVIITTPDHTHCQITCDFLRDGKPVLLEKPMALKKDECDEISKLTYELIETIMNMAQEHYDTVMPGYVLSDFGDFIRTGANSGDEDDKNLDNISVDLDIFEAYAKGYLHHASSFLNDVEINSGKLCQ